MTKTAIYGGSFDPITRGHLDIISQGLAVFDRVIITIGVNTSKAKRLLTLGQSKHLIEEACREVGIAPDRIEVHYLRDGVALVRYAEEIGATAILRGLRQVSDFDSEFRLNGINALVSQIPQVYMICHTRFLHVSSSAVKEMASLRLPIGELVTPCVEDAFRSLLRD